MEAAALPPGIEPGHLGLERPVLSSVGAKELIRQPARAHPPAMQGMSRLADELTVERDQLIAHVATLNKLISGLRELSGSSGPSSVARVGSVTARVLAAAAGDWKTSAELAAAVGAVDAPGALYTAVSQLVKRHQLERSGSRGSYRYRAK